MGDEVIGNINDQVESEGVCNYNTMYDIRGIMY